MLSLNLFVCVICFALLVTKISGRHFISIDSNCLSSGEQCIEIYQCPYFNDLLQNSPKPRPPSVIKAIREKQCGFIGGSVPKVCCAIEPSIKTMAEVEEKRIIDSVTNHRNYHLLPSDICGPLPTNSRITSGTKTFMGEFPWMALVIYYTDEGLDFRCGGTVINERYILTAAHCVLKSIVGVRLGEYDISTTEDCEDGTCAPPVQDFYIEKYIVHPEYDPKTFANDVALIRLATPANFTYSNVQPICLPTGDVAKTNLVGRHSIVSGWGVTEDGSKSTKLLKVSLPVLPNSDCKRIYGRFAKISPNQICAGGLKGKDSCGGDSGGPMKYVDSIDGQPRFVQYGIVSYGPRDCGTLGQPAIYTRVSGYVDWILDNMSPSD